MAEQGVRTDVVEAIDAALRTHADPERAEGQQRYMKSALPYFGLTTAVFRPTMTAILRDPALALRSREQWEATIRALWFGATHREQWYAAIALARHRAYRTWVDSDAMPLWESLIRDGAWWDVVDEITTHLVRDTLLAHPDGEAARMRRWATDEHLWVRRAAILSQVGAKERTNPRLLEDVIRPNISSTEFFLRKAIGWALRDYARTDGPWVQRFVAAHPDLSGLSRREALKHVGPGA